MENSLRMPNILLEYTFILHKSISITKHLIKFQNFVVRIHFLKERETNLKKYY